MQPTRLGGTILLQREESEIPSLAHCERETERFTLCDAPEPQSACALSFKCQAPGLYTRDSLSCLLMHFPKLSMDGHDIESAPGQAGVETNHAVVHLFLYCVCVC